MREITDDVVEQMAEAFEEGAREQAVKSYSTWMRRDPRQTQAGIYAALEAAGIEVKRDA